MPWLPTETTHRIEREHSAPVRRRYAKSARAHHEALRKQSVPLWPLLLAVPGLVAAYACVLYLLIR